MKRIFLGFLALCLCLSIVPAFADTNINITTGDGSPVNVTATDVDGCGNTVIVGGGPTCTPTKPGATCILIDGVPSCIEPPDYCGPDPDYCARMARHSCLKNAARDAFGYLEGRLNQIGWCHGTYKFVRSFETRVIYGSRGNNNNYKNRRPITFFYKTDHSIKVKAYFNIFKRGKDYMFVFTTDFTPAKKCDKSGYTYSDELLITGIYTDGYDAVDDFIAQLEAITNGDAADDTTTTSGCNCNK